MSRRLVLTPTQQRVFNLRQVIHKVPDKIVGGRVRQALTAACGPEWYACVMFSDGRGALSPSNKWVPEPDEDHRQFLIALTAGLNRRASYMGSWAAAWVGNTKFVAMWRDADGDMHATFEDERPWEDMIGPKFGLVAYADLGNLAIKTWAEQVQKLDVADWQQHRAALGESAPRIH